MTVSIGSYSAVERLSGGHRAANSAAWRGEDTDGQPVGLLVLPATDSDEVRDRVAATADVSHPHLLPVLDVTADDQRIAVVFQWPRGGRLVDLVRRRGTLDAGETLTVLIPLASALAAVHRAGFRHGGVGAGSVFFDELGRPQLGALASSLIVCDSNDGMPTDSWDVAPEVVRGERLHQGPMTPAADVFSLGSVALFCLTGSSAWPADDPTDVLIQSTAGVWPSPPDDVGPPALLQLIRQMLLADPTERPAAADLVTQLAAVGSPSPIPFGPGSSAGERSAARWGGWTGEPAADPDGSPLPNRSLRRGAGSPPSTTPAGPDAQSAPPTTSARPGAEFTPASRPADRRASSGRTAVAAGSRNADPDSAPGSRRRWPSTRILTHPAARPASATAAPRRPEPTPLARAGIAALSVMLTAVLAVQVWVWVTQPDDAPAAVDGSAAGSSAEAPATSDRDLRQREDWLAIVTALDAARGKALSTGDPALLDQVYVAGSDAAAGDSATIRSLTERGLRVEGALHRISAVTVVTAGSPGGAAPESGTAQSGTGQTRSARSAAESGAVTAGAESAGAESAGAESGAGKAIVRVAVRGSLPSYPVLDGAGRQVGTTAARPDEERILSLVPTADGFRIGAVDGG